MPSNLNVIWVYPVLVVLIVFVRCYRFFGHLVIKYIVWPLGSRLLPGEMAHNLFLWSLRKNIYMGIYQAPFPEELPKELRP